VGTSYYRDNEGIIKFGKRLREIRKKAGYSQEQLANQCDLPMSQISRIETGKINTSLSHICLIARVLKIKPSDLMDFNLSKRGAE
jgi:transcriptional regulator with XRE-family HTH domain